MLGQREEEKCKGSSVATQTPNQYAQDSKGKQRPQRRTHYEKQWKPLSQRREKILKQAGHRLLTATCRRHILETPASSQGKKPWIFFVTQVRCLKKHNSITMGLPRGSCPFLKTPLHTKALQFTCQAQGEESQQNTEKFNYLS